MAAIRKILPVGRFFPMFGGRPGRSLFHIHISPIPSVHEGLAMSSPKGRNLPLSVPRRLMCDLVHFSRRVPLVSIERRLELGRLVEAREALSVRPSWFALFLKAFGLVARRRPELRRFYRSLPWPHLHEHASNVGMVPVERRVGDEDGVLFLRIRNPESWPLPALHQVIQEGKQRPLEEVGSFRNALRLGRLPLPLRRLVWWVGLNTLGSWRARYLGTFGLTGVSNLRSANLEVLTPLTSTLSYGVIDEHGSVTVRLAFDHRVLDGMVAARALEDLQRVFLGPLLDEVRTCRRTERGAVGYYTEDCYTGERPTVPEPEILLAASRSC
jgi:hypothetical protein